jgi:hypothetical protein
MSLRYWSCIAALYFVAKGFTGESQVTLAPPPEVRSQNHIASLTLHAALNISGRDAFAYEAKYRLISSRRPKSTDAPSFLVVTSKPRDLPLRIATEPTFQTSRPRRELQEPDTSECDCERSPGDGEQCAGFVCSRSSGGVRPGAGE